MKTGITQVREALERGERLTSLEAFDRFGMYHLASTIRRLKAKGLQIESETIELSNGKLVARYHLPSSPAAGLRYFPRGGGLRVEESRVASIVSTQKTSFPFPESNP